MDYKKQAGIDLHIHSNASDGSFHPCDILRRAKRLGLKAISITDHDTLAGVRETFRIGVPKSIQFISGVEISADFPIGFEQLGSCHILGYFIRLDHPQLNDALRMLQDARINRNPSIIKKLNTLGIEISMDDVVRAVETIQIGRPHIAQTLLKKKIVKSIDEAFDKYLGYGKPAYVGKYRIPSAKAIQLIRDAGGVPVLAHPYLIRVNEAISFESLIRRLKALGLLGLEVYYPEHTVKEIAEYSSVADHFKLLITGGTDFHGALTPDIEMGSGKGDLYIPYDLYEKLSMTKKAIDRHDPNTGATVYDAT